MLRSRFSREESTSRGHELYERIRPQVEGNHRGQVVAIDLETGTYEVAADTVNAAHHLRARCPDAQTWFVRIGHEALYRFGPRSLVKPA
jgi:hypothetical protein